SRANMAPRIRNLIGYTGGIPGRKLLARLKKQAEGFNTCFEQGEAIVRRARGGFAVHVNGKIFHSKYVILALGMKDVQPKGVDFADLCQRGYLAYCPICDGFEQSKKKVGVLINSRSGF